ncbi:PIN domain-containing protein [Leifsonia sp. F6_8S_P_1B]|uniref:PIN domain-containing protein n=1 Tax=Leifsonia williamsii TaxID=3035919 RepID=A0ABT8K745_9MICO|nr:PIN domain-containing protein [Leifsonia williamsii]MDN4613270.1 PIN domain-containing protein [Leifsonia williamsii]
MTHRIFVDSNVLVSRTQRDWLFQLRLETSTFQLHSTPDAIAEAVRAWRRRNPAADGRLTIELDSLLRRNLDEVLEDFAGDVPFGGADIHDLHIHAAAVWTRADILLTDNARDVGNPDSLPYEVQSPDDFFLLADDSWPSAVRRVVLSQREYWRQRASTDQQSKRLELALLDSGCPRFAGRVGMHLEALAGI